MRVVKYGQSIEFCGGTHVANTGMIGSFRIVSEGAIAAGMRRIEAVTAAGAEQMSYDMSDLIARLTELFKGTKDLSSSITRLQEENGKLKVESEKWKAEVATGIAKKYAARLKETPVIVERVDFDVNSVKDSLLALRNDNAEMALVLGSITGGKPSLLIVLGQARVDGGMNAGNMVRTLGKEIQGGGGGQPHFATAGGKNADGLDKALSLAHDMLK